MFIVNRSIRAIITSKALISQLLNKLCVMQRNLPHSQSTGILRTHKVVPRWLDSLVGRALHRYRGGHGFVSGSGLNFFQAFISQLLKLCVSLR